MTNTFSNFIQIFFLSLVVASVSVTITKTKIFKGWREFLDKKNPWLGSLFKCPYCLGHWVSWFFYSFYRNTVVDGFGFLDYIVSSFVLIALASLWSGLLCLSLKAMELDH